jgi:hypothetical protein
MNVETIFTPYNHELGVKKMIICFLLFCKLNGQEFNNDILYKSI